MGRGETIGRWSTAWGELADRAPAGLLRARPLDWSTRGRDREAACARPGSG